MKKSTIIETVVIAVMVGVNLAAMMALRQRQEALEAKIEALQDRQYDINITLPEMPPIEVQTPEPDVPQTAAPSRYAGLDISDADRELLARLVWLEARGESAEGQRAVAEVVLNRVLHPAFPDTVAGVIYQKGQFTPAGELDEAQPEVEQYEAVDKAIAGDEPVVEEDVVYFATKPQNDRVYVRIGGHWFCRV